MYKVFFNDSSIQISGASKKSFKNNITQFVDFEDNVSVRKAIYEIESSDSPVNLVLQNNQPEKLWNSFKDQFVLIPAAGGLVQNHDGSLLFIKRFGVWDLPKGKIEKNETPEHAAIREVEEECGLSGLEIIKRLDSTFHIYRSPYLNFPDNLALKETKWFLMSCTGSQTPVPQAEEDIIEAKWFKIAELDKVLKNTYSSLNEFLDKAVRLI